MASLPAKETMQMQWRARARTAAVSAGCAAVLGAAACGAQGEQMDGGMSTFLGPQPAGSNAPAGSLSRLRGDVGPLALLPDAPVAAERRSECVMSAWALGAAVGCAGAATALQKLRKSRRRQAARSPKLVARRFFNFGAPEPEVDPEDPGRQAMCSEYQNMPGTLVAAEESEFGVAVVSRHDASEQDGYWPGGEGPGDVKQEWRELRLADKPADGSQPSVEAGTGQSVVKVSVSDAAEFPAQVPYCMALGYTKSLCAVAMTGMHAQGALPLDAVPKTRALVVGLGAGSIPLWLDHTFPDGNIVVDALEIDPAVVTVATDAMGFPKAAVRRPAGASAAAAAAADALAGAEGQPLRIYEVGGEVFVEELAKATTGDYKYDMVFIDAFDKKGKVPPVLVDPNGVFLQGLSKLLAPRATIALNLLIGMTGSGSSGGPKEIEAMVSAIHGSCCQESAEVFTVRTPINESSGNQLFGFLCAGRESKEEPLKDALKASAEAVTAVFPADSLGKGIRFDFGRRVNFSYRDWPEQQSSSGGGGLFGF
eukprot:TRINITY_DN10626_c0_g1_i2.p1 TRINITY_DN10626_c0_g1~~TRINITY_DN10626_c0_g1_i2.p1  ORF type:complete len:562 (+),score=151.68 TRINITY_DN10626_c0_g1_i2:74-1687(+)